MRAAIVAAHYRQSAFKTLETFTAALSTYQGGCDANGAWENVCLFWGNPDDLHGNYPLADYTAEAPAHRNNAC